jgi:hypothetical protein
MPRFSWLLSQRDEFAQAHVALERVRQAMRRDRRASARAHSYEAGESGESLHARSSFLRLLCPGSQAPFLCGLDHSKWLNM